MVANLDNMGDCFKKCNKEFFESKLPLPAFEVNHSYKNCAYFHFNFEWYGNKFFNPIIRFTDLYDFSEDMFIDIMCHEMIHYYLAYFNLDRKCKHGKEFHEMANRLNDKYHLNIVDNYAITNLKRNYDTPPLQFWLYKLLQI